MSRASDINVCPWCPAVGSSVFMANHSAVHELDTAPSELDRAKAEIKRLKVQLKERQRDYAKTLGEMATQIAILMKEKEDG